jgi:hypothetical protein
MEESLCQMRGERYGTLKPYGIHEKNFHLSIKPRGTMTRRPFYTVLYVQVLIAIALGILLGVTYPAWGIAMKPLGDGFIKLIKMVASVARRFCTSRWCRPSRY